MPVIKRGLKSGDEGKPISVMTTPSASMNDPYDWENSFDRMRTTLEVLADALSWFSDYFWELLDAEEAFELPLDGQLIPRELILALLQVSLLRDPDFDCTEDFRGFLELFATERAVRFGATESDAQGHYAQVEVFAGETPVAKVFVGGFLERWPDQAYAWAMWRFGVDPGQMGEFLEQLLPEE